MKRFSAILGALAALVLLIPAAPAAAQTTSAVVVAACGTPPSTYATGANRQVTQDTTGRVCQAGTATTTGSGAAGTTATGNPVGVGGVANSAAPTYTAGQRTDLQADLNGNINVQIGGNSVTDSDGRANTVAFTWNAAKSGTAFLGTAGAVFNGSTWDRQIGDVNGTINQPWAVSAKRWNYAAATGGIVNTATAVTIKAAAGAAVRNYLNACQISHDTLGAATELAIRDGAAGTVLWRGKLQTTAAEQIPVSFDSPLGGTANTLVEVVTLTAVTGGVYVNCQGYTGS